MTDKTKKKGINELKVINRLGELIKEADITKADLAKSINTSPQAVNGWFTTGHISAQFAYKVATFFDVNFAWVMGFCDDKKSGNDLLTEYKKIPSYTLELIDGKGVFNPCKDEFSLIINKKVLPENCENLYCIKVQDNSLAPEVYAGNKIVIDTADTSIIDGSLYALWINNRLFIKHVTCLLDKYSISSSIDGTGDTTYIHYNEAQELKLTVVGRVVWRGGKIFC